MIGLLILGGLHAASASAIPRYDVDRRCAYRARGLDSTNSDRSAISRPAKNQCVQREQEAYDELRVIWRHYDADIRARCRRVGDAVGNYEVLLSCIVSMDVNQSRRRSAPFHY